MESNGELPNKSPAAKEQPQKDRQVQQLPTVEVDRDIQEPGVSISPTAANDPNQKPKCHCKKGVCKHCHGCKKCKCACNGELPYKSPATRGRTRKDRHQEQQQPLPTIAVDRDRQEPRQVSISPTAANSPNQKDKCRCKKGFCKKCLRCKICECECNSAAQTLRPSSGRPPRTNSEPPPRRKSGKKRKQPPPVRDSQESWMPQQPQN
jgi:hypothetical protein